MSNQAKLLTKSRSGRQNPASSNSSQNRSDGHWVAAERSGVRRTGVGFVSVARESVTSDTSVWKLSISSNFSTAQNRLRSGVHRGNRCTPQLNSHCLEGELLL